MCVIIDASICTDFCTRPKSTGFTRVHSWLDSGKGRIVIGGTKYRKELSGIGDAMRLLAGYAQAGIAIQYSDAPIDAEAAQIERESVHNSDDEHVLALARVSGARILCTDDRDLMSDFKDVNLVPKPRGRVFPPNSRKFRLNHHGRCPMPNPS